MFKRIVTAALVFGAAALAPPALTPANAQSRTTCLNRDALTETLTTRYSESLTGGGLQNANQLIEIWSSPETGSFTVFITRPDGTACVVATGESWQSMTPIVVGGVSG
ncbi:MAG: hypothetical protein ACC631_08265 [Halocynthiibacter sp.]